MKRQIFTLLMVLVLATGAILMAQSNPNTQLPPSQQVDQSGQPEQSGHPDVDVDTGKNANNGVLNVDVKRHGDSDTKAGNNPNGNKTTPGTTGRYTGTTTSTGATTGMAGDTTYTTRHTTRSHRTRMHHTASKHHRLPKTGSDMPLVGLLGALSLAGALGLRKLH
jgi:LPXTG-motif cell wall-anchored protein